MNNTFQELYEEIKKIYKPPQSVEKQWYMTYDPETGKPKDITVDPNVPFFVEITDEQAASFINMDPSIIVVDGKIAKQNIYKSAEDIPNRLRFEKSKYGNITTWPKNMLLLRNKGTKYREKKI